MGSGQHWFLCLTLSWPKPKHSYLKLESNVVNGDGVFPGIILRDTRQKGLCEVESGDPKDHRGPTVDPVLQGHRNKNSQSTKIKDSSKAGNINESRYKICFFSFSLK